MTRAEVLTYLTQRQPFHQDRSNVDLGYTRNRIRHELLPYLADTTIPMVAVLCRLAEQADEVYRSARNSPASS